MAGLFTFILIVQTLVAVSLITLILMQRSEGGGLAGGGSPAGMMSARGASDFLTRGTAILATAFVALSIVLAAMAAGRRSGPVIDPGLANPTPAAPVPAGAIPGQAPAPIPGLAPATKAPPAPAQAPAGNQTGAPIAQ
jgi:preprotein translocase subunit SecG